MPAGVMSVGAVAGYGGLPPRVNGGDGALLLSSRVRRSRTWRSRRVDCFVARQCGFLAMTIWLQAQYPCF